MTERYYRLRVGSREINGEVIEVDTSKPKESRLRDFIASYSDKDNNLSFKILEETRNSAIYEVTIPEMQFSAGGCIPALNVSAGPGWSREGQRKVRLKLGSKGDLSPLEKRAYIDEITMQKALSLKKEEFYHSMQMLWIAGF